MARRGPVCPSAGARVEPRDHPSLARERGTGRPMNTRCECSERSLRRAAPRRCPPSAGDTGPAGRGDSARSRARHRRPPSTRMTRSGAGRGADRWPAAGDRIQGTRTRRARFPHRSSRRPRTRPPPSVHAGNARSRTHRFPLLNRGTWHMIPAPIQPSWGCKNDARVHSQCCCRSRNAADLPVRFPPPVRPGPPNAIAGVPQTPAISFSATDPATTPGIE